MNKDIKTLLITGAGVDRTPGIDFPLAATLLPEVTSFADSEGKSIDAKLRSFLPNLRFTFNSLVTRAIEDIAVREVSAQKQMIERLKHVIDSLDGKNSTMIKHGTLLIKLFNKLVAVAQNAELDSELENLIRDVFQKNADEFLGSDSILDITKISLSDTFKAVLKATLRLSLKKENHAIADALGAEMLNIENLLIEKFLGFYNNKPSEIKNYIYISWMLWAFLVTSERKVKEEYDERTIPFYSKIPKDWFAITLNYTSFLKTVLQDDRVIYFHGGLAEYVNMTNRQLVDIDGYSQLDLLNFLATCVGPNICVSDDHKEKQKHVIPALVPPLKLKPVLSSNYIEKWHKTSEWVRKAQKIIVVGYSFNTADEHFNDILRKNVGGKEIVIIAPDVDSESAKSNYENLFGFAPTSWTQSAVQGRKKLSNNNVSLIKACAHEVDLSKL